MNSTYLLLYSNDKHPEYGNANQHILSLSDEDVEAYQQKYGVFETPLSIYLKSGGMFLLESIERGENDDVARAPGSAHADA